MKIKNRSWLLVLFSMLSFSSCQKDICGEMDAPDIQMQESIAKSIEGTYCYDAIRTDFDGLSPNGWNPIDHYEESGTLKIEAINENQVRITDLDVRGVNYSFIADCKKSTVADEYVYLKFEGYRPYDENSVFDGIRCVHKHLRTEADGTNFGESFDGKIHPQTKELLTQYIVKKDDSEFGEAIFINEIKNCKKVLEENDNL